MRIRRIKLREIFATNSRKTLEIEIETTKGRVRSSVPMGTSKGSYEVRYLKTEEAKKKFLFIKNRFILQEFDSVQEVDNLLRRIDPSDNFKEIGGNLALAISSGFLKAFALNEGLEIFEYLLKNLLKKEKVRMPRPICNVIGFKGQRDVEEYLLLPVHQNTFKENIEKIMNAYFKIRELLKNRDPSFTFTKDLESAWFTRLPMNEILKILTKISNEFLLKMGLDFAASHMWDEKRYYVYSHNNFVFSTQDQLEFIINLAKKFPIIYFEDPFREDDFISFSVATKRLAPKMICGDDLLVTNIKRLKDAIDVKAVNAVIVKPNQVGTISDTINFVKLAQENKIITIMSHRSGETEDTLICHLAVGLGCDYVKFGTSGERTAKINELLRIEEKLMSK
jgi:enolase